MIDGATIDSESLKGSVVVLVYLSAEQRSSELAAVEAEKVVAELGAAEVKLVHVTADVVHKPYFERFRADRSITTPLAFDPDRSLYGRLGLIVFPTTIVVDREGKLSHVISARAPDYSHVLSCYLRHTLGLISDAELEDTLKARASSESSPKSLASTHRAAARLLREKGLHNAAKDELRKALEKVPDDPDLLLDLADLDLLSGELDSAETLVSKVLAAHAEHRRAKQLRGIALYRRGDLDGAEQVLLEALSLNPEPARIHYYLGRIYEQKGQMPQALEHYREALRRTLNEPETP
jgi:tetratricopeptide (TPR) repeat protein